MSILYNVFGEYVDQIVLSVRPSRGRSLGGLFLCLVHRADHLDDSSNDPALLQIGAGKAFGCVLWVDRHEVDPVLSGLVVDPLERGLVVAEHDDADAARPAHIRTAQAQDLVAVMKMWVHGVAVYRCDKEVLRPPVAEPLRGNAPELVFLSGRRVEVRGDRSGILDVAKTGVFFRWYKSIAAAIASQCVHIYVVEISESL